MTGTSQHHLLLFEPRVAGHHLTWLRYLTEDFLAGGFRLTLALDWRPGTRELIQDQLALLMDEIAIVSIFNQDGRLRGRSKMRTLAECFRESGAEEVFVNSFDEFLSGCLRLAALGIEPPERAKGRLNGIYFRPLFLANRNRSLRNAIKFIGFRRLCKRGWFGKIYLMDEYLHAAIGGQYPESLFHVLPDPWHGDFSHRRDDARKALNIPTDKFVLLQYGIGTRRKGLHLAVRTALQLASTPRLFLLCAGQIRNDPEILRGIDQLERQGKARVLNRYVSDLEEQLAFCASDIVLLPYIKHFGSSGVLARAAAAGKMVIASDEGLLARRVREHGLGWLFPSGNVEELEVNVKKAMTLSGEEMTRFRRAGLRYASLCSRSLFRKALLAPYSSPKMEH
jgi:glycosyltransferase involved in cell wall biosynthesis